MKAELQEAHCSIMPAPFSGLNLLYRKSVAKKSVWLEAIDENNLDLINKLISLHPADINRLHVIPETFVPEYECTALSYALRGTWKSYDSTVLAIIQALLNAGANPNLSDRHNGKEFETPFARFAMKEYQSCPCDKYMQQEQWLNLVKLLLDNGADPNATYHNPEYDQRGHGPARYYEYPLTRTVLMDYANFDWHYKHDGLLNLLAGYKIDPNKIVDGKTVLDRLFNLYFSNLCKIEESGHTRMRAQFDNQLVWKISELINIGASLIVEPIYMGNAGHQQRCVSEDAVSKMFAVKASACAYKSPSDALVPQMRAIFNLSEEEAACLSTKFITNAKQRTEARKKFKI